MYGGDAVTGPSALQHPSRVALCGSAGATVPRRVRPPQTHCSRARRSSPASQRRLPRPAARRRCAACAPGQTPCPWVVRSARFAALAPRAPWLAAECAAPPAQGADDAMLDTRDVPGLLAKMMLDEAAQAKKQDALKADVLKVRQKRLQRTGCAAHLLPAGFAYQAAVVCTTDQALVIA